MADDPVEVEEPGTSEETVEDGAADSPEVVEEDSSDETGETADGDESEGHEEASNPKRDVKYSRFRSVNERRKAAEAKAAELERQLAALTRKDEPPKSLKDKLKKEFVAAPTDLSPLEQFQFYARQAMELHTPELVEEWFQGKFGMSPEAAAATLAQSRPRVQADIRREFEAACKERGMDPNNRALQHMVGSAMDAGVAKSFSEALDAVKPKTATKAQPRKINGNGAETESVEVGGNTRVKNPILTKEQAAAMAAKGQRVQHVSVLDILSGS